MPPKKNTSLSGLQKSLPRDKFLYLLLMATLYIGVTGLLMFLNAVIDLNFSSLSSSDIYLDSGAGDDSLLKWGLSSLLIAFPIHLWTRRVLARDLSTHPEKHNLGVRHWLTYLTLFISALVGIVYGIHLINTILDFKFDVEMLKTFTSLVIVGGVFYYYFRDIH